MCGRGSVLSIYTNKVSATVGGHGSEITSGVSWVQPASPLNLQSHILWAVLSEVTNPLDNGLSIETPKNVCCLSSALLTMANPALSEWRFPRANNCQHQTCAG